MESTTLASETTTTVYERGLARLIHHEIDHLDAPLYTNRMRAGVEPMPREGVPPGWPSMDLRVGHYGEQFCDPR
ncbi:hypothetical protein [Streptomyces sp. CB02923]|uniref:hypothetical protein n=1 Tax=Streptomyces sp. CB02923 TaxID=1718985 RepID=UPI002378D196|nr:hypothetical protein [Streptomyces sp. CB02923]